LPPFSGRPAALAFAVGITVARFAVIYVALLVAPLIGITGWYMGLFANALCVVFAVVLVSWLGMWRDSGLFTLWRSPKAALLVLPFVAEALVWTLLPGGLVDRAPGFGLWALTLLLVGINEELVSRVAILRSLAGPFSPVWAVVATASLFGLQHLSQLAITARPVEEVLWNVLFSGVAGFAYAAFQLRFSWLWPLILCHVAHDYFRLMARQEAPDSWYAVVHVLLLVFGAYLLWSGGRPSTDRAERRGPRTVGTVP
jgi:membrane protease YdiL (CAAX protease family)